MQSSEALARLTETPGSAVQAFQGRLALRLVDAAVLLLRVAAILVLLSPFLGAAFLFG